jgi:hypothetical protein
MHHPQSFLLAVVLFWGEPPVHTHSGFCPEGLLQKKMASHAIWNFCGLLSKAASFLDQPLEVGRALLHGGCSTLGGDGSRRTI